MIGLIVAVALSAMPIQSATWDGIRADGWTFKAEGTSRKILLFTRPAPQGAPFIWMRYEFSEDNKANGTYRSMRALIEADCSGFKLRSRQTTSFTEPNLNGASIAAASEDWFYPGPDTLHEEILRIACEQGRGPEAE